MKKLKFEKKSLLVISYDNIREIFQYLKIDNLISILTTCKLFYDIIKDDKFMKIIVGGHICSKCKDPTVFFKDPENCESIEFFNCNHKINISKEEFYEKFKKWVFKYNPFVAKFLMNEYLKYENIIYLIKQYSIRCNTGFSMLEFQSILITNINIHDNYIIIWDVYKSEPRDNLFKKIPINDILLKKMNDYFLKVYINPKNSWNSFIKESYTQYFQDEILSLKLRRYVLVIVQYMLEKEVNDDLHLLKEGIFIKKCNLLTCKRCLNSDVNCSFKYCLNHYKLY